MTQIESIQMNIHQSKVELNSFRRMTATTEIEKAHKQSAIDYTLEELKGLKFCLDCAVKQSSK